MEKTRRFKITGVVKDKEFNSMPFGRQLEHLPKIKAFKETAKSVHVSQKRRTFAAALKEAIALYDAKEYYCETFDLPHYRDDSFEFFYKS